MDEDDASPEQAAERDRLARASILVIGDAMLLRRVDGVRSAGAGVAPVLVLGEEHASPGGGAALVDALGRLGVASAFVCVLGDDLPGAQLTELVGRQRNVEPWLLVDGSRCTVTETIYAEGAHALFRTVREDTRPVNPSLRARMMRIATETLVLTGLVALADRGHGTLDIETTAAIITGARAANRLVIADIGHERALAHRYGGIDALVLGVDEGGDPEAAAHGLRTDAEVQAAVLLVGDGTIVVADKEGTARFEADPTRLGSSKASIAPGDALHVGRVAVFGAALATGRNVRGAALLAATMNVGGAREA